MILLMYSCLNSTVMTIRREWPSRNETVTYMHYSGGGGWRREEDKCSVQKQALIIPTSVYGAFLLKDEKVEVGGLKLPWVAVWQFSRNRPSSVILDNAWESTWWLLLSKQLFSSGADRRRRISDLHLSLSCMSKTCRNPVSAHHLPCFKNTYFSAEDGLCASLLQGSFLEVQEIPSEDVEIYSRKWQCSWIIFRWDLATSRVPNS